MITDRSRETSLLASVAGIRHAVSGRLMVLAAAAAWLWPPSTPGTLACNVPPDSGWAAPEAFVWSRVCGGRAADLAEHDAPGGVLDPASETGWTPARVLRSEFLKAILTREPYRSAIPPNGVRITGAWLNEPLDLSNADVAAELWLESSRFTAPVTLNFAELEGSLSLERSAFDAPVAMVGATIVNQLSLLGAEFRATVDLSDLEVGRHIVSGRGAVFHADLSLYNARTGGAIQFDGARLDGRAWLYGIHAAKGGGFTNCVFGADVVVDESRFGSGFLLDGSAFAATVSAMFVNVDGAFSLRGATFDAGVDLYGATIGQSLELAGSSFAERLRLSRATVAGNVVLRDTKLQGELLSSDVQIRGQLMLERAELSGRLLLEDAKVEGGVHMMASRLGSRFSAIGLDSSGQVAITDSRFHGKVDLDHAVIERPLLIRSNSFLRAVTLTGLSVGEQVELSDSTFSEDLGLAGARLGANLVLDGSVFESDVVAGRLSVAGDTSMKGVRAEAKVLFRHASIGGETFLGDSRFRKGASFSGTRFGASVYVFGSSFDDDLLLMSSVIDGGVYTSESTFLGDFDVRNAKVTGSGSLSDGSTFRGDVNLDAVVIGQELFLNHATFEKELSVKDARIGGAVQTERSTFKGKTSFDFAAIEDSVHLGPEAAFEGAFSIGNASVTKQLVFAESRFEDEVSMESLVAGSVLLGPESTFVGQVSLGYARVRQEASMSKSTFHEPLVMSGAVVDQVVIIGDEASLEMGLSLDGAVVKGDVAVMGSRVGVLSMAGSRVEGALNLGSADGFGGVWTENALVDLSNAELGALQVPLAWNTPVHLDGLVYERLGGEYLSDQPMLAREARWFVEFLALEKDYSPQPYKQLAEKLKENGQPEKADEILYAGKERERSQAGTLSWMWLTALKYVIGYGFGNYIFRVCYWIAMFVVVGTILMWLDGEGRGKGRGILWSLFYSFDRLLPIIELSKEHGEIDPTGPAKYYFYWHILAGYVLALFLVAGISGLTSS